MHGFGYWSTMGKEEDGFPRRRESKCEMLRCIGDCLLHARTTDPHD